MQSLGSGVLGFFVGVRAVFSGALALTRESELRKLALVPLLITLTTYLAAIVGCVFYADNVLSQIWQQPEQGWLVYVWWGVAILLVIAFSGLLSLLFVSIASVISGPFYEKMAFLILE